MAKVENKFKSPNAVRSVEHQDFYTEYDKHDRNVFHKDKWGFWSLVFYPDEPHVTTPNFVLHKYWHVYNPNGLV